MVRYVMVTALPAMVAPVPVMVVAAGPAMVAVAPAMPAWHVNCVWSYGSNGGCKEEFLPICSGNCGLNRLINHSSLSVGSGNGCNDSGWCGGGGDQSHPVECPSESYCEICANGFCARGARIRRWTSRWLMLNDCPVRNCWCAPPLRPRSNP